MLNRLTKEKIQLTELLLKNENQDATKNGFEEDLRKELHLITKTTTGSDEEIFKKVDKIMEATFQKKSLKSIEDSFLRHEQEVNQKHRLSRQVDEFPNILGESLTRNRENVAEPNRQVFSGPNRPPNTFGDRAQDSDFAPVDPG